MTKIVKEQVPIQRLNIDKAEAIQFYNLIGAKEKAQKEAEKQRKIQEAEDYIKSHNLYQVKVAGGLVQLSFLPQDDAEKEKLQKKSKEITIEEYENLAFIPYPYPIKDENDDPLMQK